MSVLDINTVLIHINTLNDQNGYCQNTLCVVGILYLNEPSHCDCSLKDPHHIAGKCKLSRKYLKICSLVIYVQLSKLFELKVVVNFIPVNLNNRAFWIHQRTIH